MIPKVTKCIIQMDHAVGIFSEFRMLALDQNQLQNQLCWTNSELFHILSRSQQPRQQCNKSHFPLNATWITLPTEQCIHGHTHNYHIHSLPTYYKKNILFTIFAYFELHLQRAKLLPSGNSDTFSLINSSEKSEIFFE